MSPFLSPVVPQVVKCCADFIEKNGVVDGIYRLSGISSNIQKLRFVLISYLIPTQNKAKSMHRVKQYQTDADQLRRPLVHPE